MNILSTKSKSLFGSQGSEEVSVLLFFASVIRSRSISEIDSNGKTYCFDYLFITLEWKFYLRGISSLKIKLTYAGSGTVLSTSTGILYSIY